MEINPISSKRIYQSVIEQFVGLLKAGKVKPGDKLPSERTLAELFQVSRASIREAFSAMEIIGLIEVRPGDGSFVTDLNIAPFLNTIAPLFVRNETMETELLEFRKLLELEAVELAATKGDPPGLKLLQDCLDRMKVAIECNDPAAGAEADILFHTRIFNLTGNFILIKAAECVASLVASSVRFNREKILINPDNARKLYQQHWLIYEAIANQQPESAKERMRQHLGFVREIS
ncbi:MAG TPA: FadR/GntR family transcriptional regulator [Bacillota bacterium]